MDEQKHSQQGRAMLCYAGSWTVGRLPYTGMERSSGAPRWPVPQCVGPASVSDIQGSTYCTALHYMVS